MRTRILMFFAIIPALSNAQMMTNDLTGAVAQYPVAHPAHIFNTTVWYTENHWQMFSLQQQADWDSKVAAERAATEAAAAAEATTAMPDPQTLAPVISNGVKIGEASIVVDAATMLPYATPDTMSPKHPKDEQIGKLKTKVALLNTMLRSKNYNEYIVAASNFYTAK